MKEYILSEYDTPFSALENVIGELIRCKDCKHFETKFLTEGAGYFYNPCPRMIDRTENDFCSRAERKEE